MLTLLGSVLLFAASAHLGDEPAPSDGRRLVGRPSWQPIWGDCLTPLGEEGCSPGGGFQCSDRLSPGPEDADVEIVIKDLPPSSLQEPVHLQFWSPRKSPTHYNPLVSLVNCSIYQDVFDAYPHFDAGDFNGGNVLVSESGEATIRVRSPGMYMMLWRLGDAFLWEIRLPHIHMRLCHGTDFLLAPAHVVVFSEGSVRLAGTHRPHLELVSAGPYADRSPSPPYNASAPAPVKIVVRSMPTTQQSTTLPPTATTDLPSPSPAPTPSPSPTPSPVPTPSPSPTPSPVPTPTPSPTPSPVPTPFPLAPPAENGVLIDAAKSALDLDALEFSPVYRCLLDKAFFDHFSSSCSEECPAEAVVKHGQCVHPETDDDLAEVAVTWKLEIDCGEPCWHDKKLVSLHNVRLSAADLLNVPFQEVKVEMGFLSSASRRLADARVAYLTVRVTSNRVATEAASAELQEFVRNVVFISQLLGLDVLKAAVVPRPDGQFLEEPVVKMDQDNDPYEPAYLAVEPGPVTGGSSVLSFLPTSAIVGIATGVVLVLSVFLGSLVLRRRRAQRAAREANIQAKVNEKVADEKAADPEEANPNAETAPKEPTN